MPLLLSGKPLARGTVSVRGASRQRTVQVRAAYERVPAEKVKFFIDDKGYTVLDVRTPEEFADGSKKFWKNLPIGFMTNEGPILNGDFRMEIQKMFPNKMSRVLIACDDGGERSDIAAEQFEQEGYTAIKILDRGIADYLSKYPLTEEDKKPQWRLVGQTSGVRYAYNDGKGTEFDDGA